MMMRRAQGQKISLVKVLAISLLGLAYPIGLAHAAPNTPFRDLKPDTGWSEAIVSVSNLARSIEYFDKVAGWKVVARNKTPRGAMDYWQLPDAAKGDEALLCNPGDSYGCVRLIQFSGVAQVQIRSSAQPWETGGIFSLMTRSRDLDGAFARSRALGFSGYSDPTLFDYQGVQLENVVLRGPDGVNIAIYQRNRPNLEGWETIRKLSSPFNAMQMVRSRDASRDFYITALGYGILANADFTDTVAGPNNFAIPSNLVTSIPRRHAIMGIGVKGLADAAGNRQVELMQFVGLEGRDLSERAVFPNLGIVALRFPTEKLDAHVAAARAAGYRAGTIVSLDLPGWGKVRMCDLRSPDGVISELIERQRAK